MAIRWVYPRACGGTGVCSRWWKLHQGLSPRVRGNLWNCPLDGGAIGSIPARAGEPRGRYQCRVLGRVYPRACGGTMDSTLEAADYEGLSPRVRGNQRAIEMSTQLIGSIPARAGEPGAGLANLTIQRVYPRACGGTSLLRPLTEGLWGLSPRVRGNLKRAAQPASASWSIPARAGEPRCRRASRWSRRVYPRACGGTLVQLE